MVRKIKNLAKSKLLRSAGIYTTSNVINKAIPFFLLPVLTRYLTPEDYGIVSMFGVLLSLVTPFTGIYLHAAIERMYYEKDTINIREYITNCLMILIVSTSLVGIIFYFFSPIIARWTSLPIQLLWVVIAISFAQFVSQIVVKLWQVQVKPFQYGAYQISKTLINALLSPCRPLAGTNQL